MKSKNYTQAKMCTTTTTITTTVCDMEEEIDLNKEYESGEDEDCHPQEQEFPGNQGSCSSESTSWRNSRLPNEIIHMIIQYSPVQELLQIRRCNKTVKLIVDKEIHIKDIIHYMKKIRGIPVNVAPRDLMIGNIIRKRTTEQLHEECIGYLESVEFQNPIAELDKLNIRVGILNLCANFLNQRKNVTLKQIIWLTSLVTLFQSSTPSEARECLFNSLLKLRSLYGVNGHHILGFLCQFRLSMPETRNSEVNDSNLENANLVIEYLIRYFFDPSEYSKEVVRGLILTLEQQRICENKVGQGEIIKINAFPGTGKTETLNQYAIRHPDQKILYLAYNKVVVNEGRNKLPKNVTCQTWHALAKGAYNPKSISSHILIPNKIDNVNIGQDVQVIIRKILKNYFNSIDDSINAKHVPHYVTNRVNWYIHIAQKIFNEMGSKYPISHDGYLKKFQLSNIGIPKFDLVMVDEAQDMGPLEIDILKKKIGHMGLMIVGDTHQFIYGFRGCVNGLEEIKETKTFRLTKSFRFGPEIGRMASILLRTLKNETSQVFAEWKSTQIVCQHGIQNMPRNYTYIARRNCTLVEYAFDSALLPDVYINFAKMDRVSKLISQVKKVEKYFTNGNIPPHLFHKCPFGVKMFQKYHATTSIRLNSILNGKKTPNSRVITLITSHSSKGSEYDHVLLSPDLANFPQQIDVQEINLIYVAMTRAKKTLIYPPQLYFFTFYSRMDWSPFSVCVIPPNITHKCDHCNSEFEGERLGLMNKKSKLYLCKYCSANLSLHRPILDQFIHSKSSRTGSTKRSRDLSGIAYLNTSDTKKQRKIRFSV